MEQQPLTLTVMKTLTLNELVVTSGGGDSARTDLGQFVGAYARSLVDHAYLTVFAGTYAFFDALAYALEE